MAVVKGSKLIYLYRVESAATSAEGTILALTSENSKSVSKDADTLVTKDGSIRTPNEAEITISATSLLDSEDTMISTLESAMLDDELMEVWEVDIDQEGEPVYAATADTDIVEGKTYYTRTGSGTAQSPYVYTEVENPVKASLNTYYEMIGNQYPGMYYQGYLTSFEKSSPADGNVECTLEFAINGKGASGDVTVTAENEEAAAYAFVDTTIQSAG